MATKHDFHKIIVGRTELLSFRDLDLSNIPAKVDTGAGRSAIHAENIILGDDGVLRFDLLSGHVIGQQYARHIETREFRQVSVENSFGHREIRYAVMLRTKLGPKVFTTIFTLADRSKKNWPILIGCTLLDERFLVDTSKRAITFKELKKLCKDSAALMYDDITIHDGLTEQPDIGE